MRVGRLVRTFAARLRQVRSRPTRPALNVQSAAQLKSAINTGQRASYLKCQQCDDIVFIVFLGLRYFDQFSIKIHVRPGQMTSVCMVVRT